MLVLEICVFVLKKENILLFAFAVEFSVKSRNVTVKGPRGVLRRSFKHLAVDIRKISKNQVIVEKWFGAHTELAAVRTVCSHIENMFKGVIKVSRLLCRFMIV